MASTDTTTPTSEIINNLRSLLGAQIDRLESAMTAFQPVEQANVERLMATLGDVGEAGRATVAYAHELSLQLRKLALSTSKALLQATATPKA